MPLTFERREEMVSTPMSIVQYAISQGAGIDVIKELVALKNQEEDRASQKAFDEAMQKAQAKMRRIGVDATNPQTHSKYATYAKLDATIRPIYTENGLALSFDTGDSPNADTIRLLCYVSHPGYTRTYKLDMPADGKGAKGGDVMTKTHATGAALTYGKRYLLNMIFNLAVGETDDDGNVAEPMADQMFIEYLEPMENAATLPELQKAFTAAYKAAEKLGDKSGMAQFIKAKDKRKKELNANG
jgi:hypothetical protein